MKIGSNFSLFLRYFSFLLLILIALTGLWFSGREKVVLPYFSYKEDSIPTQALGYLSSELESSLNFEIGDLVFRKGIDLDSALITYLSGSKYSHIGMVVQKNPLLIVHATTNDKIDERNMVILSSLKEFLSHSYNFALAKIDFLDKIQKIELAKNLKHRLGDEFILAKKGEKNLYCTTLLSGEISKFKDFSPKYLKLDILFFEGEYLFPNAFWEYPGIRVIYINNKGD